MKHEFIKPTVFSRVAVCEILYIIPETGLQNFFQNFLRNRVMKLCHGSPWFKSNMS